jgi:hypothetical protein
VFEFEGEKAVVGVSNFVCAARLSREGSLAAMHIDPSANMLHHMTSLRLNGISHWNSS